MLVTSPHTFSHSCLIYSRCSGLHFTLEIFCVLYSKVFTHDNLSIWNALLPGHPWLVPSHRSGSQGAWLNILYLPPTWPPRQACPHPRAWQLIVQRSNLSTPVYTQVAYGCLCVASPELRTMCVAATEDTRSIRLKLCTIWPLSGRACQVLLFL